MTNKKVFASIIITAVVAIGLGFWFGSSRSATGQPMFQGRGQFFGADGVVAGGGTGARARGAFSGAVSGEVVSNDGQSLVVKTQDGGSKIVFYSGSTSIMKTAPGMTADLVAGTRVTVAGTASADGSVVASSIQVRPEGSIRDQVRAPAQK